MACRFRYPNTSTPTHSYDPPDPSIGGSGDDPLLGLDFQRTADGELVASVQHGVRRRFVREFQAITYGSRAQWNTFAAATRGLAFYYFDETLDTDELVKLVESSEQKATEGDLWTLTLTLEETDEMPNVEDFGDTRKDAVTFAGGEHQKTVTLPQPFEDALYDVIATPCVGSDGQIYFAFPIHSMKTATTYELLLSKAPPTGVTVRVAYLAIHN